MTTPTSSTAPAVHFAPERAFHLLALAIMVLAIGAGLARYFGWIAGLAMGLALSYVFSALVTTVMAPAGQVARSERLWAGLFSLALFGVTMGLSYGTLYASLFAQSSALGEFSRLRAPVERQLESSVLANAEAAVTAFAAWQTYSARKAEQEGSGGGSCAGRATSLGARGPIAMWRETETGIAANLHGELRSTVQRLRVHFDLVRARKAATFAETAAISASLNSVIESANALAHGAYTGATRATLARQMASTISWPNGDVFRCGDRARDELLLRAQAALSELGDAQKNPPIAPLKPAIDLSNQQELTIRGLLRAFNAIGMIASLGAVGNFADDPLMQTALREKGLINRETLGFFIAGLIELCVLFTGFLAARSGGMPFPFQPARLLAEWELRLARRRSRPGRWLGLCALGLSRILLNLLFASVPAAPERLSASRHEARFGRRELEWASVLAPCLVANQDGEYLVVPHAGHYSKVLMAAQALTYQRLAVLLNLDVQWEALANYWPVARRLERALPDVLELHYAVFKLQPAFAQAMRLELLATPGTSAASLRTAKLA